MEKCCRDNNPQKIVTAPGCSPLSRMVESKTGKRPHLVSPCKAHKFSCDSDCPNFKSFGICSHIVAVAEVNQMLLDCFKKQKKIPNMSALAKAGMPTGRGRKGGEPPRKRNKCTPPETRVPFNPTTCSSANPPISTAYSHAATIAINPTTCSSANPHISTAYSHAATIANVSTRNTAGKVCNVIVTQTSLQNPAFKECPFKLHFISENISRCAGCKGQYPKPALPPNNLCIEHEEWRQITFPNSPSPSTILVMCITMLI